MTPYRLIRMHALPGRTWLLQALLGSIIVGLQCPDIARAGVATTVCIEADLVDLKPAVEAAGLIVIGEVVEHRPQERVAIRPEAYLKGPAETADILLAWPGTSPPCPPADFTPGSRVLVLLDAADGILQWPGIDASFTLSGGRAHLRDGGTSGVSEAQLVADITGVTDQYAVPAAEDEGAGLNFRSGVLPVAVAVAILFAIGLVLMQIWHRIDPS